MQSFINDNFMSVFVKDNILFLVWKNGTCDLTDEAFKGEALKYMSVVKKLNSKRIIVDMRKFDFVLSDDVISWRNENIVSVYNEFKVERFAFISEKPTINQDNPNNTFITKSFLTEEEAVEWILS